MVGRRARCGILLALLFLVLALGGCGVTSERSEKASPDWSRGLRVGEAYLNEPVALAVDAERGRVHLVWSMKADGRGSKLHYVQLDKEAKVLVDRDLDVSTSYPHKPQLLLDGQGNLRLAWLAYSQGVKGLFQVPLGPDGGVLLEPVRLSPVGKEVESYQMCLNRAGQIGVFWAGEGKEGPGIYHLLLDKGEEAISTPVLIAPGGAKPVAQLDRKGTIHLAWLQEPFPGIKELYYAAFPASEVTPKEGIKLTRFPVGTGLVLQGLVLGLDASNVYIFWSIERRGGGLGGAGATSWYVSFPLGQPLPRPPASIVLPSVDKPRYSPYEGLYSCSRLAYLPSGQKVYGSDLLHMPATVGGQQADLPVVFSLKVYAKAKAKVQLAMVILSEGEPKGYQLIAKTDAVSLQPSVAASGQNLHLAWIDTAGFWRYHVYYASTSPEVKAWLDRKSPQDMLISAIEVTWGVLSGMALIPLAFAWIFPPLIGIILFEIFGGDDDLGRGPARVVLGVAVILYLGTKLLLSPIFLLFASLSDQVPPQFALALIVGVPVVILALALGAMYAYMRRAERASLLMAFAVFALTDTLLSLAIYSPGFFGGG